MLPSSGPSGTLSSITLGGNPVAFTTQTIKGVSYAMFAAVTGSYQAIYSGSSTTVVLASVSVNPTTVVGGTGATGQSLSADPHQVAVPQWLYPAAIRQRRKRRLTSWSRVAVRLPLSQLLQMR